MNKRFIRVAVFCALTATAAPVFVGCSDDYDADIAGLQDQINKINGVVGITGDDMAAAIDEVVEQLQARIDSLGGVVSDKVNVDELTASVNNLNQLIDSKADASQIQAEADRLQGLIEAANQAAADANAADRQALEQQISELEGKQEQAQQTLNEAIAGKADQADIDQLRTDLTTVTNDLAAANNKLQQLEGLSEDLGGALTDLATAKSDLETLKGRVQALEEADLNLGDYAEFSALADRVTALEGKWGNLSSSDIAANTSAIAEINRKLDAFFAEKADATAKEIYDKLKALEDWKADVVDEIASISSKADQSALDQVLLDIEDLKDQLGLIGDQDPDEGEDQTANFYNKEEIDAKFDAIKTEINSLVGTMPQSIVYMPNFDNATNQFSNGITFRSLFIDKLGTTPVATSAPENTIVRFRVSPASAVEEIKKGTYTLTLDGKRMKSIPKDHITLSLITGTAETNADEAEGIITYQVNTGTLAMNEAWALCVNLKKAVPEETTGSEADAEADKTVEIADKTDLTSNYFTLFNQTVQIDGIDVDTKAAYRDNNTDDLAYMEHTGTTPFQINYAEGRKLVGYNNGSIAVNDLEAMFDLSGKISINYSVTSGSNPSLFTVSGGLLTLVNHYSTYIGETAVVTAQPVINGTTIPNKQGGQNYGTTYDQVKVVNILWSESYNLIDDTKFTVSDGKSKTEWIDSERTFTLNPTVVDELINRTKINRSEFFNGLATSAQPDAEYTDAEGKTVILEADATNEKITVTYDAGVVITGSKTLKLTLQRSDVSLPAIEINVPLAATTFGTLPNPTEDVLPLDPGNTGIIWNAEKTITTLTPVPTTDDNIAAMIWNADLSARFASTDEFDGTFSQLKADVEALGGHVVWEAVGTAAERPAGINYSALPNAAVNSAYDMNNANQAHELKFRINFKYGAHTIQGNTYTLKVADISGKFVMPDDVKNNGVQFTSRTGSVKLSKGCSWTDATSAGQNIVWSEGKVVTTANTTGAVYATSFFDLLGIDEPTFELVNPEYKNFVNLNPTDGTFSLTADGQTAFSSNPATVQVKVVIKSRFGTVEGQESNIINVHVNI